MRIVRTATMAAICVLAGIILASGYFPGLNARTHAAPIMRVMPPEYMSVAIDADSLEEGLADLARDQWEIISIVAARSVVDRDDYYNPVIITESFQVTARRPWAPPSMPRR